MELNLLWTIQLAPIAAFLAIQGLCLLAPKPASHGHGDHGHDAHPAPDNSLRKIAPLVGILGAAVAAGSALALFGAHPEGFAQPMTWKKVWIAVDGALFYPGAAASPAELSAGFLLDNLNLMMITLVTVIAFFVQIFSAYYMADDPSRPRYFGFLSLFSFSMTGLVLSSNLLQTFIFWELVGLASYLLIGFWYQKKSAGDAARKAFVLNRLGDLGFYLGVILLFLYTGTLNFTELTPERLGLMSPFLVAAAGICVLAGVFGKSAQFPFHVWLPDAMEGPTPVSALIHSATMVAAGVFLLSRAFPLFHAAEATMHVILVAGALTAMIGACLAAAQSDIKKILAYSTVSQLGLMAMAAGCGAPAASMFHLTTHAFFKSLLFLTSGSFIHHFHSNDIWEIAQAGGKKHKIAMASLAIGLLSLSGVFPFAGFFSKDLILEELMHHSMPAFAVAIAVSFLTVYYSARLFCVMIFTPEKPSKGHDAHHATPAWAGLAEALPLVCLAALSLVAGFMGSEFAHHRLVEWFGGEAGHTNPKLLAGTTVMILVAAGLAFVRFRDPIAARTRWTNNTGPLKAVLDRKFFMDDAYFVAVKKIGLPFAALLNLFDRKFINDVMVNDTSYGILNVGKLASRLQSGLVQNYLFIAVAAGAGAALWLLCGKGF